MEAASPNISETCPARGCGGFDALHSEPGELQRRQCSRCGEVWTVKANWVQESLAIAGEKKEETMAKEKDGKDLNCQECERGGFKSNLALAIHRRKKHGIAGPHAKDRGIATAGAALAMMQRHPNTTPSVREELLDTLRMKKNALLHQVSEVDDMIEKLEG